MREICEAARTASSATSRLSGAERERALIAAAESVERAAHDILEANGEDCEAAERASMRPVMMDRLRLTSERVAAMASSMRQIAALPDPIGRTVGGTTSPGGLRIEQRRMPIGVVGMIYESRPNVTADAASLCLKSGNACVLRGGSDAARSSGAILEAIRRGWESCGIPGDAAVMVPPGREAASEMMRMTGLIDVLIPRGSGRLIQAVASESRIPVIETGVGNCHVYIDASADPLMARDIIVNAKTSRPSVCNACESIVVHRAALPMLAAVTDALRERGVEVRGDDEARAAAGGLVPASDEDWGTEYLDLIVSVKTVGSIDEAISHISRYGTKHSECIVTSSYGDAMRFLDEIDAAAVYVNASTRFTDGGEFGLGAEIGISTQKLHARGPMGMEALTTTKFVIFGNGQVR